MKFSLLLASIPNAELWSKKRSETSLCNVRVEHNAIKCFLLFLPYFQAYHTRQNLFKVHLHRFTENSLFKRCFPIVAFFVLLHKRLSSDDLLALLLLFNLKQCSKTQCQKIAKKVSFSHYSKNQIFVQNFNFDKKPNIFTSFSPKFFLTIFLVKSNLSTAKKSKTAAFSRVFT